MARVRTTCPEGCTCKRHTMTAERRQRIAEGMRGNTNGHGNKDVKRGPFTGGRVSGMKGKKHSAESNRKRAESLMRSKHRVSKPELALRKRLTDEGFIIETDRTVDVKLSGRDTAVRPDIIVGKIVFEMYGCWYHGCEACGYAAHKQEQRAYDHERQKALEDAGYEVRVIWEHEVYDQI